MCPKVSSSLKCSVIVLTCRSLQTDKKYQLADWRVRPLPQDLVLYARMDTHYLLYIYDRLKVCAIKAPPV